MAVIKCKMCGGDLNLIEGASVAECEYCGTKQTVPTADNEKKMTLFGRAGRLLRACEFDKAAGVYEGIVADFPEEAEAYWGLVLCKYGIEYVDDPATGRKIPTCHRSSFDSVLDDENFEQAYENADELAKRVYRDEAKAIEALRRGIIEVSGREAPYDVFICYKETDSSGERTLDSVLAQDIYDALTEKGYRVFFSRVTLEDKLGQEYEPYIFAALNSAKVMLAVGTDYQHFDAVWVKNEWSRFLKLIASGQKKTLIPCYKGIDAYDMPKEFAKLQAQDLGKVGAMQDLLRGVDKILGKGQQVALAQTVVQQVSSGPSVDSLLKRGKIFLGDGEWAKADEYFDRALDMDPECACAYFCKLLAARHARDNAQLLQQGREIDSDPLFLKALRYADETYAAKLNELTASIQDSMRRNEQEKRAFEREMEKRRAERIQSVRRKVDQYAVANKRIATTAVHTVGVKSDGTVVAVGNDDNGQCDVSDWTGIVAISAGVFHTVGVKYDGTVSAVGFFDEEKWDFSQWEDIVAVAAGNYYNIGIKSDGTVLVNSFGEGDEQLFSHWTDIIAAATKTFHAVGLKSNGTVVAVGDNENGQCNVSSWRNIISIAAGGDHTVGLESDGGVVAVGSNRCGQCDVSNWKDIIAIAAGTLHTVGLKSDGTVLAVGENDDGQCNISNWTDIIAIFAGEFCTVGLKSDGTVVAVGKNDNGQCNVAKWKLFDSIDTLEYEVEKSREVAEKRRGRKRDKLSKEAASLKTELNGLHGVFTGKRRKQIETRLAEIDRELNKLK